MYPAFSNILDAILFSFTKTDDNDLFVIISLNPKPQLLVSTIC